MLKKGGETMEKLMNFKWIIIGILLICSMWAMKVDMTSGKVIKETVLSFILGIAIGSLLTYLRLPLPAPPTIGGIMFLMGIFIGFKLIQLFVIK